MNLVEIILLFITVIIIFGLQFIWKYILFKLLTLPARLYLRYKKK